MKPTAVPPRPVSCNQCARAIEECAFCEREECRDALCYRCVRIALAQELPQPHGHGG